MPDDREVCGGPRKDPQVLVGPDGGVQDAMVYLSDVDEGKPAPKWTPWAARLGVVIDHGTPDLITVRCRPIPVMQRQMTMRPGHTEPNEFEVAILERMAKGTPSIRPLIGQLHVLSREFTGAGSYTNFDCPVPAPDLADRSIGLDSLISMPGVPNGMGAVLFCENGKPKCLEVFTYGDDNWEGVYEGFSFESIVNHPGFSGGSFV